MHADHCFCMTMTRSIPDGHNQVLASIFFFLLEKLFNLDTGHNREEKAIKTSVSCRLELFF